MLSKGFTIGEIAKQIGKRDDWVSERLAELRLSLIEQALERSDELSSDLRERILELKRRSGTAADAAGASTRKRRTGSPAGTTRTTARRAEAG